MPEPKLTYAMFEQAYNDLNSATTAAEVRAIFKRYFTTLGYKRLCKMFVHGYGPAEMWLHEEERIAKGR